MNHRTITTAIILSLAILICCLGGPARAGMPVPDTGQTKCYNNTVEIPCPQPGEPCYGQDANYTINPPSYTKLGAGGVELPDTATQADGWLMTRDNVTGLVWEMKDAEDGTKNYANPHDVDNTYTWCDTNPATNGGRAGTCDNGQMNTEAFIKALNGAAYGGFTDWRLPDPEELHPLVDYGKPSPGPAIDTGYFPSTKSSGYWLSTTFAGNTSGAWYVYFGSGSVYNGTKGNAYYVRAVRGGQSSRSLDHLVISGVGKTVTDLATGLVWQRTDDGVERTWQQALAYGEDLHLAGLDDWRLPTIKELASIVDLKRFFPAIDTTIFSGTKSFGYWSSTTGAGSTNYAWHLYFDDGSVVYDYKDYSFYVRAVRGGQGGGLFDPLLISTLTPTVGTRLGGTTVTITGYGFGAVQESGGVSLGGVPATVTSWSEGRIVFTTPAHGAATVELTVTRADGQIVTEPGVFVFDDVDGDGDGFNVAQGDCNDADPLVNPAARETCDDGIDNDCNGVIDSDEPLCTSALCRDNSNCGIHAFCRKTLGDCSGTGSCTPMSTACPDLAEPVCGCDGATYGNTCEAEQQGMNSAKSGACPVSLNNYYFPAIKDNDAIGWENYLSVQAKDPVPMEVTIRVFDMNGVLKGIYIYSDTDPAANSPALAPNARVAQRPSLIVGTAAASVAIEGSVMVETSVPAIASTNCIANFYKGFSIYEAAKVRQVHNFPKAYDGPDAPFFQVYMLAQNIHAHAAKVTVKLFGKTTADPGHGVTKTYTIPAYGTLKVRPSEVAPLDPVIGMPISFSGSVVITSDLASPGDGLGQAIPAMCRFEAGAEALAIYESTVEQPALSFPVIKDGKIGGLLDYQNFVSVVNPSATASATITLVLYNNAGMEEGRVANYQILPGGKKTWRPSWVKGTQALPKNFEGSIVVTTDIPVVGQTNTIYPGSNPYGADGFDLLEASLPASTLYFPKVYDNLLGSGTGATHLTDNLVYIQNPDATTRNVTIELYNNNGTLNRTMTVAIAPHATHVFRPKNLVTDGSGIFRGSVRVTEQAGMPVTGGIKYEVHKTLSAISGIEAMTIYRSMGQ